jgi:hypothetical protein
MTMASAAPTDVLLAEVLGSWQGDGDVQFVELAITRDGATDVSGASLTFTTASARHSLQLTKDMANGSSGSRILFATERAIDVLGVTPDFVLPTGYLPSPSGRICYQTSDASGDTDVVDCLAYGGYQGSNDDFGRSLRIGPDNRSLVRIDSTGSNRSDWRGALQPTPQNNAGVVVTLATLCGDDHIDAGEQCDETNLGGRTCRSFGYSKGDLACSQCHFDFSDCIACGNGVRDTGEECDDADFGDRSCTSLGFTGGDLLCTSACKINTAGCDPTFFVPGGGPTGPDCVTEWKVTNGAQRPGRTGKASVRQVCTDGDPSCDTDEIVGRCTFAVSVCFNVADSRFTRDGKVCKKAPIASWSVLLAAGDDANELVENARTIVGAMAPSAIEGNAVFFTNPLDVESACSQAISAVVTAGKSVLLKTRTSGSGGRPRDVDALKLVCVQ